LDQRLWALRLRHFVDTHLILGNRQLAYDAMREAIVAEARQAAGGAGMAAAVTAPHRCLPASARPTEVLVPPEFAERLRVYENLRVQVALRDADTARRQATVAAVCERQTLKAARLESDLTVARSFLDEALADTERLRSELETANAALAASRAGAAKRDAQWRRHMQCEWEKWQRQQQQQQRPLGYGSLEDL
jgi:hypothetical protein